LLLLVIGGFMGNSPHDPNNDREINSKRGVFFPVWTDGHSIIRTRFLRRTGGFNGWFDPNGNRARWARIICRSFRQNRSVTTASGGDRLQTTKAAEMNARAIAGYAEKRKKTLKDNSIILCEKAVDRVGRVDWGADADFAYLRLISPTKPIQQPDWFWISGRWSDYFVFTGHRPFFNSSVNRFLTAHYFPGICSITQ